MSRRQAEFLAFFIAALAAQAVAYAMDPGISDITLLIGLLAGSMIIGWILERKQ